MLRIVISSALFGFMVGVVVPSFALDTVPMVSGFFNANCFSFNDKTGKWDRLRNPSDFVAPSKDDPR